MKPDYKKSLEESKRILQENYVTAPPVRIDQIAQNYGYRIFEVDLSAYPTVSGYIKIDDKQIFINKDDSQNRKAFTIAHELGHALLHPNKLKENPDKYAILFRRPLGGETDPIEKEANCFAANVLVPRELLDKYKDEDDNIIAEIFGVSPEVIGYRKQREYGKS